MEQVIPTAVFVLFTLIVTYLVRDVKRDLGSRFDRLEASIDARFDQVDARFGMVEERFNKVEASIDALRSDLTQVALAVGAGRQTG